jgi:hypothetical protein
MSLMLGLGLSSSASSYEKIDHSIIKSTEQNAACTDLLCNDIPDSMPNSQKVSDVPDNFLDDSQAQLFLNISHELSDYMYFADPAEFSKTNRVPSKYGLEQWTQQEKEKIEEDFAAILHRAPGLLLAACGNNKLVLCRATSKQESPGFVAQLATLSGIILVPDGFFQTPRQLHCLTHELLHLADSAQHLSFSVDWADFANPPIALMHRTIKHASPTRLVALNRLLKQDGVFPNTEGYRNLTEAFAYYFTEYIDGTAFSWDRDLVDRFGPHFLRPTPKELQFTEHYVNGQFALSSKNFDLARTEFCKAKDLDASAALVYLNLAMATKEPKLALDYCRGACDTFEAANVPRTEHSYALAIAQKRWLERSISAGSGHIVKLPDPRKYLKNNY